MKNKNLFILLSTFSGLCVASTNLESAGLAQKTLHNAIRVAYAQTLASTPHTQVPTRDGKWHELPRPTTLSECKLSAALNSGLGAAALSGSVGALAGFFIGAFSVDGQISGIVAIGTGMLGGCVTAPIGLVIGTWRSYARWNKHFNEKWQQELEGHVNPLLLANNTDVARAARTLLADGNTAAQLLQDGQNNSSLLRLAGLTNRQQELDILAKYLKMVSSK